MQYAGIGDEHRAVRTRAGVFDVSHMGELRIAGDGAREYLQARLSNDLDRIGAGQAQYTLLTNERGGIVDDLIAYRRGDDDYLLVVNAANVEADHDALAETEDVSSEWAYLAVQGPEASSGWRDRAVRVSGRTTSWASAVSWRAPAARASAAASWVRRRTPSRSGTRSSTECRAVRARRPRHASARGLLPAARNDISAERTPIEAGLGWACALDKGLHGVDVLRRQKEEGPPRSLRPSSWRTRDSPPGHADRRGRRVTSGTLSPMLDVGIGLGYARPTSPADTDITIDLAGGPRRARIVRKPFYKREES